MCMYIYIYIYIFMVSIDLHIINEDITNGHSNKPNTLNNQEEKRNLLAC